MRSKRFRGYRADSMRNPNWDYSSWGTYFVTINTKQRVPWFGEIQKNHLSGYNEIFHSSIGKIAIDHWKALPDHYPFIKVDHFTVMPDHFHGIIDIPKKLFLESQFQREKKNSLGNIVGSFKSAVTRSSRLTDPDFAWQSRYHDNIITNPAHYQNTVYYIKNNIRNYKL